MNVIDILKKIEDSGFEAYIVGGYVRDYVLGIESRDIDICTNARVKELNDIFCDYKIINNEYGAIKLITNDFRVDITTYRRDLKYNGSRRKVEIEYVDNLIEDIKRRDFTMNTLCMNKEGQIIDILNGQEDIKEKKVRCVGIASERLEEDPLRLLRAIRFAAVLDFKIDNELYEELKVKKDLIRQLSRERIKEELTKILSNKNAFKGLKLLVELDYLNVLGICFDLDKLVYVNDICGMYSQIEFNEDFPFSKEEKNNIKNIKKIIDYGIIDSNILFTYGLYISSVAGCILGIDKDEIIDIDKNLVIRRYKDIDISVDEICDLFCIKPGKVIHVIYEDLKNKILSGKLENKSNIIRKYLIDNKKEWLDEGTTL